MKKRKLSAWRMAATVVFIAVALTLWTRAHRSEPDLSVQADVSQINAVENSLPANLATDSDPSPPLIANRIDAAIPLEQEVEDVEQYNLEQHAAGAAEQQFDSNIQLADYEVRVTGHDPNPFQKTPNIPSAPELIKNDFFTQPDSQPNSSSRIPRNDFVAEPAETSPPSQPDNQFRPITQQPTSNANPSGAFIPAAKKTQIVDLKSTNRLESKIPTDDEVVFQANDFLTDHPTNKNRLSASDGKAIQESSIQKTSASIPEPPAVVEPPIAQGSGPSQSTQGTTSYRLAEQPKLGAHYKDETPLIDRNATQIETLIHDFSPDPVIAEHPYDPYANQNIYQCKQLNANQRPLLELGRPWYQLGQLSPGSSLLGFHNNVNPQFLIFGDYRQAIASNRMGGDTTSQLAFELNTIWNLFVTSTERVVWGVSPFDNGAQNTRWEFDSDRVEFETDFDFDFGYLEGDLGAIVGGFTGQTLPFDGPFAIGLTPILIQNGVWLNDAVEGAFFTIPARNSPKLGISNMDISFGFIWDEINSSAFAGDKNAAKAYLIYSFIEALNGYLEIDYAFLEDRTLIDRSYHNIGLAYSRRFGNFISHSTRVIANAGQEVSAGPQTADGLLLLSENSLITSNPYTVIPYFNMFAGFDTPQTVAGDQRLVNTGILFESDGMTGYPTLDGQANDTFGGALGLNLLAQDFSQQLIMEFAAVFRGDDSTLAGDQYGLGMRYQIPLNNSWIFRTDGMVGFLRGSDDVNGFRMELRKKF